MAKKSAAARKTAATRSKATGRSSKPGAPVRTEGAGPDDVVRQLPSDPARPSATDDNTEGTGDDRPTAREGLKAVGLERPHPTAAARLGKTAGEAGRQAMEQARRESDGTADAEREDQGPLIRVRATEMGYYRDVRRRTGDVFDVPEKLFSARWMEAVDGRTPVKTTTAQAALDQEQGRVKARKAGDRGEGEMRGPTSASAGVHTGRTDVDTTARGTRNPLGADAR